MTKTLIIALSFLVLRPGVGQEDPVLMRIDDKPVHVSEFSYIYEKNNRDQADYSKQSLEEYLGLYTNFKLKVQRARELGYDTRPEYINELAGYRKQLSEGYVFNREVVDYLVDQLMERKKWDIGVSHLQISVPRNATEERIAEARLKIQQAAKLYEEGRDFGDLARELSEDGSSAIYGGDIGYITTPLPDGYLEFEDAAYTLEKGEVSGPVRTDLGFHLVKVTDRREARGMIRVRHILVRNEKRGIPLADGALRINEIYQKVKKDGVRFEEVAKSESEDLKTASSGGDLGFFGIGQYERSFEDAAFGLKQDGEISEPVQTSLGWHIIQRVSKRSPDTRAKTTNYVEGLIGRSLRIQRRIDKVIGSIQQEAGFVEVPAALQQFKDSTGANFVQYDWQPPSFGETPLIRYGDNTHSLDSFADFCRSRARDRIRSASRDLGDVINDMYKDYVEEMGFAYAQERLEETYPAFRNLMREYEEGILLFEITKDMVWDKASTDTVGLKAFYNNNRDRYQWKERLELKTYTIDTANRAIIGELYTDMQKLDEDEFIKVCESKGMEVKTDSELWETESDALKGIPMMVGYITKPVIDEVAGRTKIKKVSRIIPPGPKTLREARGYIVSDYQDQLEKDWIKELKSAYTVETDQEVLNKLITASNQ